MSQPPSEMPWSRETPSKPFGVAELPARGPNWADQAEPGSDDPRLRRRSPLPQSVRADGGGPHPREFAVCRRSVLDAVDPTPCGPWRRRSPPRWWGGGAHVGAGVGSARVFPLERRPQPLASITQVREGPRCSDHRRQVRRRRGHRVDQRDTVGVGERRRHVHGERRTGRLLIRQGSRRGWRRAAGPATGPIRSEPDARQDVSLEENGPPSDPVDCSERV